MLAFLGTFTVQYVLRINPDALALVQGELPGFTRVWLQAQQRDLTRLATDWARLLASYTSPDNFLEKSKQAKLHGEFITKLRNTYNMPRKQVVTNNNAPEWKGFLERKLTEAELDDFDKQKVKAEELLTALDALAEDGYQFKLSYSGKLKAYTATMVDQNSARKTAGYALSAADGTGIKALAMVMYKHLEVLERDWTILLSADRPARRG